MDKCCLRMDYSKKKKKEKKERKTKRREIKITISQFLFLQQKM